MWRSLLGAPIGLAGLAGVAGLGAAFVQVRWHGYADLGLQRNLRLGVWEHTADWLGMGLAWGVVYALLSLAALGLARIAEKRAWQPGAGVLAFLALAAGMVVLAGAPGLSGTRRFGLLAIVLLWCGCLLGARLVRELSIPRLVLRLLHFASLAIPSFAIAWAWSRPLSLSLLAREPGLLVAGLLPAGLLAWLLVSSGDEGLDPLRNPRPGPGATAWLLVLGGLLFASLPAGGLEAGAPRNVLMIAVDTLRLDHTSLDGSGDTERTPRLAAWAADATVFTTAISQAPWTMPAFASVVTGRYPREHGAVSLTGFLRDGETTLAEILREAGYRTLGVVSHSFVDSHHGFAQGFDVYDESASRGHWEITSRDVTDRAIALLEQRGEEPFFLFVHYFDPHYEYRDHRDAPHSDAYDGWLLDNTKLSSLRLNRHLLEAADVAFLRARYAEEIAFTDAQIGRVLDRLDALGLKDDTAVVFFSDHGEEFLERGWLGHTIHVYDEVVRVPLALALPGVGEPVPIVREPVETRAIFATLLDYLEIDWEPSSAAPSLWGVIRGEVEPAGMAFSEVWLPDAPKSSGKRFRISGVRTDRWKLVRDHGRETTSLYDLSADPGEHRDLAAAQPERRARLEAALERWLATMPGDATVPTQALSPEEEAALRALGYLGEPEP